MFPFLGVCNWQKLWVLPQWTKVSLRSQCKICLQNTIVWNILMEYWPKTGCLLVIFNDLHFLYCVRLEIATSCWRIVSFFKKQNGTDWLVHRRSYTKKACRYISKTIPISTSSKNMCFLPQKRTKYIYIYSKTPSKTRRLFWSDQSPTALIKSICPICPIIPWVFLHWKGLFSLIIWKVVAFHCTIHAAFSGVALAVQRKSAGLYFLGLKYTLQETDT